MNSLKDIRESFTEQNIIVIGDTILDRYFYGRADRISPEAPVPVFDLNKQQVCLGGAANVALNVHHLSASAHLITVVGDDHHASSLKELLAEHNLSTTGLITDKSRCTTVKTRLYAQGQQLIRVDEERRHLISEEIENLIVQALEIELKRAPHSSIILQDYNKGVLTKSLIHSIINISQSYQSKVFVDPKHSNFWEYENVFLFKPNLKEFEDAILIKQDLQSLEALIQAAEKLKSKMSVRSLVVTLGSKGIFISTPEINKIIPTQPRSIADVCGAGDSVISTLAVALSAGIPAINAATLANLAGGQVCEHLGVVPVQLEQLLEEWELLSKNY